MLKYGLSIALLCGAGAALALNRAPAAATASTPQQSALQTSAMAFAQCVIGGIPSVPASLSPDAGAAQVIANCATLRQQLDLAVEAYVATQPEAERAAAREQYRSQMAEAQPQIAARISQLRAAPATAAPAQ